MRWCLAVKENGTATARIVLLGFQGPPFGNDRHSEPPRSRWAGETWRSKYELKKEDVRAAFLQPQESETGILVEPGPELRQAVNEIVQPRKKAYGLPMRRKNGFDEVAMALEPCLWMVYERGATVCLAFSRVYDMVVGVHPSSPPAKRKFEELQASWKWES